MICRCPVPVESLGSALRCFPLLAGRSSPAAADRLHLHHTSASAFASAAAIRSRGTHRRTGPVLQVTQVQLWAISGRSPHWEQDPNYMYISKFTYTIGCLACIFHFLKSVLYPCILSFLERFSSSLKFLKMCVVGYSKHSLLLLMI